VRVDIKVCMGGCPLLPARGWGVVALYARRSPAWHTHRCSAAQGQSPSNLHSVECGGSMVDRASKPWLGWNGAGRGQHRDAGWQHVTH
jgi:hypothetical protein